MCSAICCWTVTDKLFQQLIECHCPVAPWSCSICERANVLLSLTQNEGSLVCLPERNLYGGRTGHVAHGHLHLLLQERGRTRRGSSGVSRWCVLFRAHVWSCGCHGNCDLEWHGQKSELLQRSVAPSGQ